MTPAPETVALEFAPEDQLRAIDPVTCDAVGLSSVLASTPWWPCIAFGGRAEIRMLATVAPGRVLISGSAGRFAAYAISRTAPKPSWKYSDGLSRVKWTGPGAMADGKLISELEFDERESHVEIPVPLGTRHLLIRSLDEIPFAVSVIVTQKAIVDDNERDAND